MSFANVLKLVYILQNTPSSPSWSFKHKKSAGLRATHRS